MDVDGEPPETGPQGPGLGRRIVMVEDPPHLSEGHASLALARPGQPADHAGAGGRGGDPMALARLLGSFRDPVILVIRYVFFSFFPFLLACTCINTLTANLLW